MNFNRHSEIEGLHAFLGASKYHWLNYDDDKLVDSYSKYLATVKGAETFPKLIFLHICRTPFFFFSFTTSEYLQWFFA